MEVPEGSGRQDPAESAQWPRGLVLLISVGTYVILVVITTIVIWLNAFSGLGGWGLVLALVVSAVAFGCLFAAFLFIGIAHMGDPMNSPVPRKTFNGDGG